MNRTKMNTLDGRTVLVTGASSGIGKEAARGNLLEGGDADESEVEAEFAAQVERALESGLPVSHLDGHQHVHLWPRARRACLAVARRFGIDSRSRGKCRGRWDEG